MRIVVIGIGLVSAACTFGVQVGHVRLGKVCLVHGAVQVRNIRSKVAHAPKLGEDLYLDEQAIVPKGCQLAFKDRVNETESVPVCATWSTLRRKQPQEVLVAQAKLNSILANAVKPRGGGLFEVPGSLPMPASLFCIRLRNSSVIRSVKILNGEQVLFSGAWPKSGPPRSLIEALVKARNDDPSVGLTLVVVTDAGRPKTTFQLMGTAGEEVEVRGLRDADGMTDPVARHAARAAVFADLGWYEIAAEELNKAVVLSPDDQPRLREALTACRSVVG